MTNAFINLILEAVSLKHFSKLSVYFQMHCNVKFDVCKFIIVLSLLYVIKQFLLPEKNMS
jgi:hypothetical protein